MSGLARGLAVTFVGLAIACAGVTDAPAVIQAKAGFSAGRLTHEDARSLSQFVIGAGISSESSRRASFGFDVLLVEKGAQFEQGSERTRYLTVCPYFRWTDTASRSGGYVLLGPELGLRVSDDPVEPMGPDADRSEGGSRSWSYRQFDVAANIGLGYAIATPNNRILVEARLSVGLIDVVEEDPYIRTRAIWALVGVEF